MWIEGTRPPGFSRLWRGVDPPLGFGEVAPDGFAMREAPLSLAHHCGHDRWRIIYAAGAKAKGECTCGAEIPAGYMFLLRTAPLQA